jgi:outer membrane protein
MAKHPHISKRIIYLLIGLFTVVLFIATAAAAKPSAPMDKTASSDTTDAISEDFETKADTEGRAASEPLRLGIKDFIKLVREKNEQISFQNEEWGIRRDAIEGAKSVFEPAFVGSYSKNETTQKNTVSEAVSQGFLPEFEEKSHNYQAAVEGMIPTGAKLKLGYTLKDFHNSIQQNYGVKDGEARTFLGVELTQPLLKGAGFQPNLAGIHVAEADADIEFQNYRNQMMRVVAEAISAYWDLYVSKQKDGVIGESVGLSEKLLEYNTARVRTGKMAETEVLEAEAGVVVRQLLRSEARQQIVSATNKVRGLFSASVADNQQEIIPTDVVRITDIETNFDARMKKAFKLRAEYLSSLKKMEREDVRIVYAKNQRWPQLDLKASHGLNGLSNSPGDSWTDLRTENNDTWAVGLEMRIPLGGDMKSRSELNASKKRKRQVLLETKAVEVALANSMDTAIRSAQSALEQLRQYDKVIDLNQRLLKAEVARFQSGKSNSRLVLEKEANLLKAKEARLEGLLRYAKAVLGLELTEGTLLLNYGIEVMEVDL